MDIIEEIAVGVIKVGFGFLEDLKSTYIKNINEFVNKAICKYKVVLRNFLYYLRLESFVNIYNVYSSVILLESNVIFVVFVLLEIIRTQRTINF